MASSSAVISQRNQANVARHAHRRSSSQWIPPSGPLYNPIEIFRSRSTRVKGSRMFQPNHMMEEEARYNYPNYRHFTDNSISTTKYNLLTFVPRNVFDQLITRYANIYFFVIAGLNFVPQFQAYSKWLALIPPCVVIGATMIKDGYEDFRRSRFDKEINERDCHMWDRDRQMFRKTQWQYVLVGDFVHVSNDQELPADILFLRSSNENGTCFVETSNLDGETSLKQRNVPRRYLEYSQEDSDFIPPMFTGTMLCEKPDPAIYTINAKIEYEPGRFYAVTKENMLLRGSKLKNTTFVEGLVLYAGHDTKVMQNNGRAPLKVSGIERKTNRFIIICVIILILMVLSGSLLSGYFVGRHDDPDAPYMPTNILKPAFEGALSIGTFIITYQVLVPISLYITVEFIKLFQILMVHWDLDLYDEETDFRINCRSLNIPEELGQITHILSDKTGTLTENKMIFRRCAFDDTDNGSEFEPGELDKFKPVQSPSLYLRVQEEWATNYRMKHFFLNIMVNNSVIVNKIPHKDAIEVGTYEDGVYNIGNASFYDITMEEFNQKIQSLKEPGARIVSELKEEQRKPSTATLSDIQVNTNTTASQVSYLAANPSPPPPSEHGESSAVVVLSRVSTFSKNIAHAVRKNILTPISSILPGSDEPFPVHTKIKEEEFCPYEAESPDELALIQGAALYDCKLEDRSGFRVKVRNPDNSISEIPVLLVLPFDSHRKRMSVIINTTEGILMYTKGADSAVFDRLSESDSTLQLTLNNMVNVYSCEGLRTLCFAMKKLTEDEFNDFKDSYEFIQQDSSADRDRMLSDKADEIETGMTLLGVTGIEDRLQDGVKQTIESLRGAGIQVWVLTGDKLETAENIARSSGLFEEGSKVRRIIEKSDVQTLDGEKGFNLILSPNALGDVKKGEEGILDVLRRANCVLCYRMTPSEKADIVKAAKRNMKGRVLAIGDGANDVPMIQAAHVGIGVKGKEGMQAVMASDFAIGRFRFLRKLVLVHGHWNYYRLSLAFLYFLYKNTNCVFVLFFYQFFNGYSGAFSIDPTYSVLYPIIFTSVQPVVVSVMDQDSSAEDLLKKPQLYSSGRKGTLYTYPLFFWNIVDGIWQAAVMYFMAHLTLWTSDVDLWTLGFYIATEMMLVNCAHLAVEVRCWNRYMYLVFAFFFGVHFAYFLLYSAIVQPGWVADPPVVVPYHALKQLKFWMCMAATTIISLLPRCLLRVGANSDLW